MDPHEIAAQKSPKCPSRAVVPGPQIENALDIPKQAQEDGDKILAVLCGSAINQDGRSSGLTVPNGLSQQKADSNLTPADVGYIEAHGTGTPLGDPIEANSLVGVLSEGRSRKKGLVLSAVKSNIATLKVPLALQA